MERSRLNLTFLQCPQLYYHYLVDRNPLNTKRILLFLGPSSMVSASLNFSESMAWWKMLKYKYRPSLESKYWIRSPKSNTGNRESKYTCLFEIFCTQRGLLHQIVKFFLYQRLMTSHQLLTIKFVPKEIYYSIDFSFRPFHITFLILKHKRFPLIYSTKKN